MTNQLLNLLDRYRANGRLDSVLLLVGRLAIAAIFFLSGRT